MDEIFEYLLTEDLRQRDRPAEKEGDVPAEEVEDALRRLRERLQDTNVLQAIAKLLDSK